VPHHAASLLFDVAGRFGVFYGGARVADHP
jgi:hypothetical protein